MSLLDTASLVITPNGTKAGTLYSVVPSSGAGDMTVTRATTATRVNSAGLIESVASNVPRLDYSNGTCPSILVEPQRTNLALYSEQFDNSSWSKANVSVTADLAISPNGLQNADKIISSSANDEHLVYYFDSTNLNQVLTVSLFVKKLNYKYAIIRSFTTGAYRTSVFDLDNGTITSQDLGTSTIESFGNGWYRISATFTSPNATFGIQYGFSASTNFVYSGDNTSGNYAWGFQSELGSYATSYIPTTSSSVTRNADVINKTGISSLIGQTEGTLFVDFYHDGSQNYNLSSISNGLYDDAVFFEMYLGNIYSVIYDSGLQQFLFEAGPLSVGRHKMAIGYKTNDTVFYIDGVLKTTDNNVTIPTTARVDIGFIGGGSINKTQTNLTALWKTRLTNTQLAQLTTI